MFGYVSPLKPELKVRELDYYKSVYCGVCRQMGLRCGRVTRLFLNYDIVFMAMLLGSLSDKEPAFFKGRCAVNPLKKVVYCESPAIEYCSDLSVLLVWNKLIDDIRDDGLAKSLGSRLLKLILSGAHRRARRSNEAMDDRIARSMDEIYVMERQNCANMDEVAATFFDMLADVMSGGASDSEKSRIAYEAGKNIGRWIYLMDAFNDIEQDLKSGSYNPLVLRYEKSQKEETPDFIDRIRDDVDYTLSQCIYNLKQANELIDKEDAVVKNIIELGLPWKQFSIMYPKEHEKRAKNLTMI